VIPFAEKRSWADSFRGALRSRPHHFIAVTAPYRSHPYYPYHKKQIPRCSLLHDYWI